MTESPFHQNPPMGPFRRLPGRTRWLAPPSVAGYPYQVPRRPTTRAKAVVVGIVVTVLLAGTGTFGALYFAEKNSNVTIARQLKDADTALGTVEGKLRSTQSQLDQALKSNDV